MKKEDLDALAGLYEGVYSPTNNGEYLAEDIKSFSDRGGALGALGRAISRSGTDAGKAQNRAALSRANQGIASFMNRGGVFGRGGAVDRLSNKPAPTSKPSAAPTQSRFAGARDAAFSKARQIQGSPVVGPRPTEKPAGTTPAAAPRPAATSPAARPATPGGAKVAPSAAAKPAGQTGDKAKDMATWAKANPTLANKPKTPNPLMQKTFGYQTGNAPDQIKAASAGGDAQKAAASFARSRETANKLGMSGSLKSISSGYEWGSKATLKDVASLYSSIYEGKKKDQDQDGDNDFADVRIARMIASGMSRAEAIAAVRNKEYNEEFEYWVDSLVEEGYDLSDYTMDEMFDIYLDEAEGSYGATPKARAAMSKLAAARARKPASEYPQKGEKTRKVKAAEKQTKRQDMLSRGLSGGKKSSRPFGSRGKMDADERTERRSERAFDLETKYGEGSITKNPKKLRKQKAMGEFGEAYDIDEATRMRKELGKEGEIETRKELAARSKAYKRSGSVDKTIAAAERGADRPYIKYKRDESDADRKKREERQSRTLRGLAASRRGSVRDNPRAGMRGYAAKVEGSDKDLQSARQKAMSAGTLTPKEKKQLGEVYEIVASYLLENNFAATLNDANVIIENMSETWLEEILTERRK